MGKPENHLEATLQVIINQERILRPVIIVIEARQVLVLTAALQAGNILLKIRANRELTAFRQRILVQQKVLHTEQVVQDLRAIVIVLAAEVLQAIAVLAEVIPAEVAVLAEVTPVAAAVLEEAVIQEEVEVHPVAVVEEAPEAVQVAHQEIEDR